MNEAERLEQQYPGILFPELGKGGYTFFKKILSKSIETGKPVYFNTGKLVYKYEYKDGQATFLDGAEKIEGEDLRAEEAVRSINQSYRLETGLSEIRKEMKSSEIRGWFDRFKSFKR